MYNQAVKEYEDLLALQKDKEVQISLLNVEQGDLQTKIWNLQDTQRNLINQNDQLVLELENHYISKQLELENSINKLNQEKAEIELVRARELSRVEQLRKEGDGLEELREQARASASIFYEQEMNLAQENFDKLIEKAALDYQKAIEEYEDKYSNIVKEYINGLQEAEAVRVAEQEVLEAKLLELKQNVDAAVEAAKREEEKRTEKDFYRLCIPESDLIEIQYLRQVEPFLREKEALNKVIWKVYYEKPYTDLIGRVLGTGKKTGIYKITNILDGKTYVGQAVDVASRWKSHCKRGVGAEPTTRNKLYPAMRDIGVHNFTFELLETCPAADLDKREDYWQEYWHSKEYGYSIK